MKREAKEYFDFLQVVALAKIKVMTFHFYNGVIDKEYTEKYSIADLKDLVLPKDFKCDYSELRGKLTWKQWVEIAQNVTLPMLRKKYSLKEWKEYNDTI